MKLEIKGLKTCCIIIVFSSLSNAKSYNWENISQQQYIDNLVECQIQLKKFNWDKTLWPEFNQSAKPKFEDVINRSLVRENVVANLKKQYLLENYFKVNINSQILKNDIIRMIHNTKNENGLKQLFGIFEYNPTTISQCISRNNIIESKLYKLYYGDQLIHGSVKNNALSDLKKYKKHKDINNANFQIQTTIIKLREHSEQSFTHNTEINEAISINLDSKSYQQKLDELENPTFEDEGNVFIYSEIVETNITQTKIQKLIWNKQSLEQWIYSQNPRVAHLNYKNTFFILPELKTLKFGNTKSKLLNENTWNNPNLPTGRSGHTAVWTGAEMIIWGGSNLNTGGRYNPTTDTWNATSTINAPTGRNSHSAVWTGTEMIIWGGTLNSTIFLNTGGKYNPISDSWISTNTINAPISRVEHTAIWTGEDMIIWGGYNNNILNSGAKYNPINDNWSIVNTSNSPSNRFGHSAIWTETEMIIWGGDDGTNFLNTGSKYDPILNIWLPISNNNAPPPKKSHSSIWTGLEMIVWGGYNDNTGGIYSPQTDTWRNINMANAPNTQHNSTAIWTGSEMIVWGGNFSNIGGRYTPLTDQWSVTNNYNALSGREGHTAVWSGNEMLIWGGRESPLVTYTYLSSEVGRYKPSNDSWVPTVSTNGNLLSRSGHTSIWTGVEMIVWGGRGTENITSSYYGFYANGSRYNPMTDTWSFVNNYGAPRARRYHTAIWTGKEMIVWGGKYGVFSNNTIFFNTGKKYDPTNDLWFQISEIDAPSRRAYHTAIWTGSEMIIWGGSDGSNNTNTGSAYNPTTNKWFNISQQNTPTPRSEHTAIWTGDEMIIWGGDSTNGLLNTGARYNPTDDIWRSTRIVGAPSRRAYHSAVWTGREMIIWGGLDNNTWFNTGARYNPIINIWYSTTITNAPINRSSHKAIWTGKEMIIWGGGSSTDIFGISNNLPQMGGRYNPELNKWRNTSIKGVPKGRFLHSMNWTGREVIIWGGKCNNYHEPMGIYYPENSYNIGGMITGLSGSQLTIENNSYDSLMINNNGVFKFNRDIINGAEYSITVTSNPKSPNQTCAIINGLGFNNDSDINDVLIDCITIQYKIGGHVSGLLPGNKVVIQNNFSDELIIKNNGDFFFLIPQDDLTTYDVTFKVQAINPIQPCMIINNNGMISGGDVNDISISCEMGNDLIFRSGIESL